MDFHPTEGLYCWELYRLKTVKCKKIEIAIPKLCSFTTYLFYITLSFKIMTLIQTEAERRRREAGVKQSMEI